MRKPDPDQQEREFVHELVEELIEAAIEFGFSNGAQTCSADCEGPALNDLERTSSKLDAWIQKQFKERKKRRTK